MKHEILTSYNQPLSKGFEAIGFIPKIQLLKEFEDDYGLKLDGDEEDDDENDDEDEEEDEEGETGSEDENDEEDDE